MRDIVIIIIDTINIMIRIVIIIIAKVIISLP